MVDCPSEDDFSRLVQGLLPAERREAIERHIDGCAACTELLAGLGRVCAASLRPESESPPDESPRDVPPTLLSDPGHAPPPGSARRAPERALVRVELALLAVYVLWCALAAHTLWRASPEALRAASIDALGAGGASANEAVFAALLGAFVVWPLLGLLGASAATFGLLRGQGWGRRVARVHAWVSAATGVLLPLSALVLFELRRSAVRPADPGNV